MEEVKVNERKKPFYWRKILFCLLAFLLIVPAILVLAFFFYPAAKVKSQNNQVSILIMGKSGKGYSSPDLTDTLMVASISLTKPKITLMSTPRDIWIPEIRAKINSVYYWGKQKPELGGGLAFAKETVAKIMGVPVNYALVLDFSSFREIVDAVGGVDVKIERSFTDEKYPIAGRENDLCDGDRQFKCRYETIHFDQGLVHMDGETALKFVRSRNGDNNENTDLAREARQQKVITAIKNKVLSWQTFLNPQKDLILFKVLKSSLETDLDFRSGMVLLRRFVLIQGKIASYVFPEDLLVNPPKSQKYDYQYVFIPKAGNWQEIHVWVKNLLN